MSFCGKLNLCVGFWLVLFASLGGAFLGTETQAAFLMDQETLNSWQFTLSRSAHGHTNLFGLLHIVLGLTLPYAKGGVIYERSVTSALSCGSFAMSLMMLLRSFQMPSVGIDLLGVLTGILLSASLVGLLAHSLYLTKRVVQ